MTQDNGASASQTGPSQVEPVPVSPLRASVPSADHPTPAFAAWATFKQLMRDDPEYAWAWHCNIAVPIMDAIGVTHEQANVAAAHLMSCLFECDITTHPAYEYTKGGAQEYHEMRLAADRAEDAA